MRARESSLARSLARSPRLLFYVRALSIVVDVMRVHARRPLQLMIAADDVVVGRCRALSTTVRYPFRTLPPFGLTVNYLLAAAAAATPGPSLLAPGPSRDGSRGQAGAGGETTTTTTSTAAVASTTPTNAKPSDRRRSRRAGTLPQPPPAYPTPTHGTLTFSLRGAAFRLRWPGLVITATRCY